MARSVVRFVYGYDKILSKKMKPAILVDSVYTGHRYTADYNDRDVIQQIFTDFIKRKTGNKFPVLTYDKEGEYDDSSDDLHKYSIPNSKPTQWLMDDSHNMREDISYLSYVDSEIKYCQFKNLPKQYRA